MPVKIEPARNGVDGLVLRDLERAVRDVLGDTEERLDVRFGAWRGEDGALRYFCKVESPPAGPFTDDAQWRWWSPLVEGPDELRDALRSAVARRRRSAVAPSKDATPQTEGARA